MTRLRAPLATVAALAGLSLLTPAAVAAPAPAAPPATCASASAQQPGTTTTRYLTSGSLTRSYRVHLPAAYDGRRAWPVVLAFHGRGSTATELEQYSGLSGLPAIVVYLNGVVGQGDGQRQAWQGAPYSAPGSTTWPSPATC